GKVWHRRLATAIGTRGLVVPAVRDGWRSVVHNGNGEAAGGLVACGILRRVGHQGCARWKSIARIMVGSQRCTGAVRVECRCGPGGHLGALPRIASGTFYSDVARAPSGKGLRATSRAHGSI